MKFNIHEYVKKHYENGDYNNAYSSYNSHSYTYKYKNVTRNKLSDFELGYAKGLSDKFNRFKFVSLKFLTRINKLFNGKLHEIIDYLEGYKEAYQKSSKGKKQ